MGKLEPPAAAAGTNEPVTCPWCGSEDTEQLAMYSSILMTDQHHCRTCLNFFERVLKR
jgi:hypothetical protein